MGKRTRPILVASLGLVAGLALIGYGALSSHSRALHIRETSFVRADGRRLAGFFEGMPRDPRYDFHRAIAQFKQEESKPRCDGARMSLLERALRIVDPTAHAQTICAPTPCGGVDWVDTHPNCAGTSSCLSGTWDLAIPGIPGGAPSSGQRFDGSPACNNTAGCCNEPTCNNSLFCTSASQCGAGQGCVNNACGPCNGNASCSSSNLPWCNNGTCVQCLSDLQGCPPGGDPANNPNWACDPSSHTCVVCSGSDKGSCDTPYCANNACSTCPQGSNLCPDGVTCTTECGSGWGCENQQCGAGGLGVLYCGEDSGGTHWICSTGSPVVVDVKGQGFSLTDAAHGVDFDFFGTGKKVRIAWTTPDSGNAWLVLDRNGNGLIDSGKEMFGNITQQPASNDPNGFLALAEFDKPENGGNRDGVIDARDAIFSKLRLWQDKNHDGISQPNELFTLPQLGVVSISLHYQESSWTDAYGNLFHYKSQIVDAASSQAAQWTYDVFLAIAGAK